MKIVLTADWHISNSHPYSKENDKGITYKLLEIERVAKLICDKASRLDKIVLHAGDFFDNRRPTSIELTSAARILKHFKSKEVRIVIIPGNHEFEDRGSLHSLLEQYGVLDLNNIEVLNGTGSISLSNTVKVWYCTKIGRGWQYILDRVKRLDPQDGVFNILMMHCPVRGAKHSITSKTGIPKTYFNSKKGEIGTKFDWTVVGDFHKYQSLSKNAHYCGSPIQLDFGEKDNDNCYQILDTNTKRLVKKRYPHTIFIEKTSDVKGFDDVINEVSELENDCVVKINVRDINDNLKKFKIEERKISLYNTRKVRYAIINISNIELKKKTFQISLDVRNKKQILESYLNTFDELPFDKEKMLKAGLELLEG